METDIVRQRLISQRIDTNKFGTPEEVVRWMGAMQAQDYQAALWAIGLRTQSATLADIEQAITDRKILRTWPMRGTLHFVPAEDARWMLSLSATRMLASDKRRQQQLELDATIIESTKQLFYNALQGGKRLTRPAAMQLLEEAGISTKGQRGYHLLWHLSQAGLICLGPMQDKQQTFVLLDEWVPNARNLSREEALQELTTRYVSSHGPATVQDFAWWTGLTLTEARTGFEAARSTLLTEKIAGQTYWMGNDTSTRIAYTGTNVHLLPGFDEYLLGYKDRNIVLAREHAPMIVPGNNGVFMPIIVVAGQVIGTWKRTVRKNALEILFHPFVHFDDAEEKAIQAANAYSNFLGLPLSSTARKQQKLEV
ncbi:hypothetical protein KDA_55700 [Dictyobacter alpinus]|uniref:Winged helix DNA-binding domain-containing protein n=1 Tax=Dictyobacter alpinus TaxID=2014873 RepID=A0A402BFI2_9CHLR|nr:winged helix DNA-binding domain-containing protein [Dictyobacter alpinus]GCE30086.1 hypothetical protein KDA_55700 [Dictyobacter alpinus]